MLFKKIVDTSIRAPGPKRTPSACDKTKRPQQICHNTHPHPSIVHVLGRFRPETPGNRPPRSEIRS
eukprot:6169248-Amphidinium_carterae.1